MNLIQFLSWHRQCHRCGSGLIASSGISWSWRTVTGVRGICPVCATTGTLDGVKECVGLLCFICLEFVVSTSGYVTSVSPCRPAICRDRVKIHRLSSRGNHFSAEKWLTACFDSGLPATTPYVLSELDFILAPAGRRQDDVRVHTVLFIFMLTWYVDKK